MSQLDETIKGVLIDLDGVLYVEDELIPGAIETVHYLKRKNFPCRFTTNTTRKSINNLHQKMARLGFPVEKHEIVSPMRAAYLYLKKQGSPTLFLSVLDEAREEFSAFKQVDTDPDLVVVGNIEDNWTYDLCNRIFRMVLNGAGLIALHKGKYWQMEDGPWLDVGAFVTGIEYATNQQAIVLGKPSTHFFAMALESIGLPADQVAMIGDDIESDVGGAQASGMKGILVKTGKYREDFLPDEPVEPDLILPSIADLPSILAL